MINLCSQQEHLCTGVCIQIGVQPFRISGCCSSPGQGPGVRWAAGGLQQALGMWSPSSKDRESGTVQFEAIGFSIIMQLDSIYFTRADTAWGTPRRVLDMGWSVSVVSNTVILMLPWETVHENLVILEGRGNHFVCFSFFYSTVLVSVPGCNIFL